MNYRKKAYCLLISLTLGFSTFRIFTEELSVFITRDTLLGTIFFYSVYIALLALSFRMYIHCLKPKYIIGYLIWVVYCVIMAECTKQDTQEYLSTVFYIAIFGGLYFLLGLSIAKNLFLVQKQMIKLPIILNALGVINFILLNTTQSTLSAHGIEVADYSMELSYANLVPALICTVCLFMNRKKRKAAIQYDVLNYINLLISYVLVLMGGSRGPLLALFIVALIATVYGIRKRTNKLILVFLCIFIVVSLLLLLISYIFPDSFLQYFRFFKLFAYSDVFNLSGRDYLFSSSIQGIGENALIGVGVFNDRIYLYNVYHRSYSLNSVGSYSHNIFLELFLQFGIPIGLILSVVLIVLLLRVYRFSYKTNTVFVYLLLLGMGFLPLLISKSYTQTWEFYMLIGFLLRSKKIKKLKIKI